MRVEQFLIRTSFWRTVNAFAHHRCVCGQTTVSHCRLNIIIRHNRPTTKWTRFMRLFHITFCIRFLMAFSTRMRHQSQIIILFFGRFWVGKAKRGYNFFFVLHIKRKHIFRLCSQAEKWLYGILCVWSTTNDEYLLIHLITIVRQDNDVHWILIVGWSIFLTFCA